MRKTFCDYCEEEVEGITVSDIRGEFKGKPIQFSLVASMQIKNPGGSDKFRQPDICDDCRLEAAEQLVKERMGSEK